MTDLLNGMYDLQDDSEKLNRRRQSELNWLQDAILQLEKSLETERMRLAACGVVALANTQKSAKKVREMKSEYNSASLENVCSAVDREMKYREALTQIREEFIGDQSHINLISYIDAALNNL